MCCCLFRYASAIVQPAGLGIALTALTYLTLAVAGAAGPDANTN